MRTPRGLYYCCTLVEHECRELTSCDPAIWRARSDYGYGGCEL